MRLEQPVVVDRDTGVIHRFDISGVERGLEECLGSGAAVILIIPNYN